MTTWSISLIFIDSQVRITTKYKFKPLYKYKDLYNDLPKLFELVGWKSNQLSKNKVFFELATYMDKPVKIKNWDKFLLNHDVVHVISYNPNAIEYGLFTEKGKMLLQVKEQKDIYRDIQIDEVSQPLLLYIVDEMGNKKKLLDVIDNPKRMYNMLINRMVKRGW